jgi:hypothetical protein
MELNALLWTVSRSCRLAGSFKIFMPNGSNVPKGHVANNEIGLVINGNQPPQYILPPIIQPEIYNRIENLEKKAYARVGLSNLSVASEKPAGVNSGTALRTFDAIEDGRFVSAAHAYEQLFLDLAELACETVKEICDSSKKKTYKVKAVQSKFVQDIDWKDIDFEKDCYSIRCFPTSSLPDEPTGRLQTIQEYIQAGFLTAREGRRLLDFPDLEQIERLANAQEDYFHRVFGAIVDDGEYTAPDPLLGLGDGFALAREMAVEYYVNGLNDGLEDEKLDLLRTYLEQVEDLIQDQKTAQAPPPPGQPPAAPMPTPRSDLIPNTAQPVQQ